jgi:hypothetical protein
VVREEGPGVDRPGPGVREARDPRDEVVPIRVVPEENAALQAPHHPVVEGLRGTQARLAGHGTPHPGEIIQIELRITYYFS